jgi:nitrite reductase/ring-hydroxylating ferredoxin subunit
VAWLRACAVGDLQPGEGARIEAVPPIAVFNIEGEFFAVDDTCTHDEASLADGFVTGHIVECVYHFAKFDLRTGKVLAPPAPAPLRTYAVQVQNDEVFVDDGTG